MSGRHPYRRSGPPLAMAHRGDRRHHPPGNTWAAFESAVQLGYRYVETDVQATRDGVLVLFHDPTLDDDTTGHGAIGDHRWDELGEVRCRAGGQVTDQGLVRLDDVLRRWPELRLNLDAKTAPTVAPLVQLVERDRAKDRVCLASFDRARIRQLRAQGGEGLCTILTRREVALLRLTSGARLTSVAGLVPPIGGDAAQIPASWHGIPLVDRAMVDAAHKANVDVHVWTVDQPDEMERLLDLGVDGIITNDAATLREVLERRDQWAGD